MRIVAQRIARSQLLLDDGRVIDTARRTVTRPRPLAEVKAEGGWAGYHGPQRVAALLRGVDEVG
jgi:hypothetical protein